jgi:putative transposase
VSEKYEFMDTTLTETDNPFTVVLMCRSLAVSKSGFYNWVSRPTSATATRRAQLQVLITAEFVASDEAAGYRRVHAALNRQGVQVGSELVRHLMRNMGLQPCQPRPWRHSLTQGDPAAPPIPDLVARDFTATAPGVKMVGDITYIPTWEGWVYLATVIDCYSKKIIGYAMDDNYRTPLISTALRRAARDEPLTAEAIFHTDRGSNYTSAEFHTTLTGLGLLKCPAVLGQWIRFVHTDEGCGNGSAEEGVLRGVPGGCGEVGDRDLAAGRPGGPGAGNW